MLGSKFQLNCVGESSYNNYSKIFPGEEIRISVRAFKGAWFIYKENTNQANSFASKRTKAHTGCINTIMLSRIRERLVTWCSPLVGKPQNIFNSGCHIN